MAEAIHCPSCSTRYRLRPERLRPSIRRARCATCQGTFPIGDVVQRLLGEAAAPAPSEPAEPPTLTLTDLEGAEAEILDKTLVDTPADLPEAKPDVAPAYPPEITETTLSGYASARDAIEKLFSEAPAQGRGAQAPPAAMDVEATLSALEQTLGGVQADSLGAGETPTASGIEAQPPLQAPPATSTVRFTREEVMAAMAAEAPAPAPEPVPAPSPASEPTVALRASDLLPPVPEALKAEASARTLMTGPLAVPASAAPETELLRLKIGEDVYPGLTMTQVIQWVEEGRVIESHLVARQFSENWIEAYKVPSLRPVFDRLRRERTPPAGAPLEELPSLESSPMTKGLFGGLFGGKN